jgi:hypothetical protein
MLQQEVELGRLQYGTTLFFPAADIRFTAADPAGNHIYEFSVFAKYVYHAGSAWFTLKRADTLYIQSAIRIIDTTWTSYHAFDTLTTNPGDSLTVILTGSMFGPIPARTCYDLCKVDVLK